MSETAKRGRGRPRKVAPTDEATRTEDRPDAAGAKLSAEDAAFLSRMIARMPQDDQRVVAALEQVKSVYVACGRDALADKCLKTFMQNVMALRNGERDEGRFFFVTGESGTGKTQVVKRMLSRRPELQPEHYPHGPQVPVASVLLQGPCSMKVLAKSILEAAGYTMARDLGEKLMWHMLPRQLHHRRVMLIHIDETQHMVHLTEADHDRKELAKAIKSLTANPGWPISFVVSGLPHTTELARLDQQIVRRGCFLPLPDIRLPSERKLVENIIQDLADAIGVGVASVVAGDMPDRVAHAAHYRYGRIAQVVLAALHAAIQTGDRELTREHFAKAYILHSHAREHEEMNPFLVQHWRRLPPGTFLIEPDRAAE